MSETASLFRFQRIWWVACLFCVVLMVWIGGLTRLTDSGLSMTDWRPVTGWLPPLSEAEWLLEYEAYRQSPEFTHKHHWMDLVDYKRIFFYEYVHRLLGRITGLVVLIPFIFFCIRRCLPATLLTYSLGAFALGGIQAVIGWYMVKSGLYDKPYVSPYRLAMHLTMALGIYSLLLVGYLRYFVRWRYETKPSLILLSRCLLVTIFVQIISGAFVAGNDAGLIYNSFPKMDGRWIPDQIWVMEPFYRNLFENHVLVQWIHRSFAYVVLFLSLVFAFFAYRHRVTLPSKLRKAVLLLLFVIGLQISLGILTLIHVVPVGLASMHQMGALLLLSISWVITMSLTAKK